MRTSVSQWLKLSAGLCFIVFGGILAGRAGQEGVRVLFDFEQERDMADISQGANNVTFDLSQDAV